MIVTGMLAWWDELPGELYECVKSMRVLCDRVVAADGAYEMSPGATARSPDEQGDAIRKAAADFGMDCTIIYPTEVWEGQVEKRAAILDEAVIGSDWVIAVDSDHRLVGDRDRVRAELEEFRDVDSIIHDFYTPPPIQIGLLDRMSPHPWHTRTCGKTIEHSLLFRALPEMRIERTHYGYSGIRRGQRVAVGNWRSDEYVQGRHQRLRSEFRVEHLCFFRDQMRLDRNRDYCKARDQFRDDYGFEP